ncbi:MAG: BspA family leucine-rich repeat surface protein, partial [Acetatifactor sp.]|nr:BspA family leucine-rich repeat surface protein [Acetatifactor sp.]
MRLWNRLGKRGLGVLLAVLLALPVFPSMAEGTVSGGDGSSRNENVLNNLEDSNSVSGGDAAGEMQERQVNAGISSVSAGDAGRNSASGVDGSISWVIDANGKLTVSGTGDFSNPYAGIPWAPYRESIISAEINVSGMTNAYGLFQECENLQSVDISGFDTGNVTNMGSMFSGCSSLSSVDV